jgi:hypothetical protein
MGQHTLKSVGALIMLLSIPPFFFPLGANTGLGATGGSAVLTLVELLPNIENRTLQLE